MSQNVFCLCNGTFHAFFARSQKKFCSKVSKQGSALYTHGFGHGKEQSVLFGSADKGKGNACVAAGWLNNGGMGIDQTLVLRRFYHGDTNTVFYTGQGILKFKLCQDCSIESF